MVYDGDFAGIPNALLGWDQGRPYDARVRLPSSPSVSCRSAVSTGKDFVSTLTPRAFYNHGMKRFTVLFLMGTLLGLLAACAPATTTEPAAATVPPPAVQLETQPTLPAATDLPAATELPAVTALPEATQPPAATAVPAATEPAEPTALPEPTAEPAPAIVYGVTDEGAYFYGNPDAPVTLIDYSDFL